MAQTSTLFQQLTDCLDYDYFKRLVKKYNGNRYVKKFSCWMLLITLVWSHITSRKSLRDISLSLMGLGSDAYRLGTGGAVSKSTLSEALENRPVAIFRDMAQRMMSLASKTAPRDESLMVIMKTFGTNGFYAVDSSKFFLEAAAFGWADSAGVGGPGVKLHLMLDLLRQVPTLACITGMEGCDQRFMDLYDYQPGCFYMFDKIYTKTDAWQCIADQGAYFVLRLKRGLCFRTLDERPVQQGSRIMADKTIEFSSRWAKKGWTGRLRLVAYMLPDSETMEYFVTNNFTVDAFVVPYLYKCRWQIELFFKWLKYNMHITDFYGRSANAVMIQIYSGIITVCMLAIAADKYHFQGSLYEFSRMLSQSLTTKSSLSEFVNRYSRDTNEVSQAITPSATPMQGVLFTDEELAKCYF